MSRFRKVRRKTYDDRTSTQAADRGASQALGAGGNAGANAFGGLFNIYPPGGIYGYGNDPYRNGFLNAQNFANSNNQSLNAYLQQNAYTQTAASANTQSLTAHQILVAQQRAQLAHMKMMVQMGVGLSSVTVPAPQPPLPREIRAGEIIGYRAWIVGADDSYWSTAHPVQWVDGRMDGDIKGDHESHAGVHAWREKKKAFEYASDFVGMGFDIAIGEVLLWGEVIEHEEGYRAQHAEIGKIYTKIVGKLSTSVYNIFRLSSSYSHIPKRPPAAPPPVTTTAFRAPERQRDAITIVGWAVFAWLAAFCVSISTGAMSPF